MDNYHWSNEGDHVDLLHKEKILVCYEACLWCQGTI